MEKLDKFVWWCIESIFVIAALAFMPSMASVLFLVCGVLLMPIEKWREQLKRVFPKKWMKTAVVIVTFCGACIMAPQATGEAVKHDNQIVMNNTEAINSSEILGLEEQPKQESSADEYAESVTLEFIGDSVQNTSIEAEENNEPITTLTDIDVETTETEGNTEVVPSVASTFAIHFIDVGQADAALVLCDGNSMLIDGGNSEDSDLIYAYLKKMSVTHLDYIVNTHAHEDHVGGLSGALNYATVGVAYAPVTTFDTKAFSNFEKYLNKQGVEITIPSAGDSFNVGSATVTVVGPTKMTEDVNNTSLVLRIVYGETSFLFTGDAERDEEQGILDAGYELESTVLKVGHHGSDTSTSYVFLREIMPEYAIISVGTDNAYGHPTEDVLSRLRDAEVTVFRTDIQGDIICTSDGQNVTFTVEKNQDADTFIPAIVRQEETKNENTNSSPLTSEQNSNNDNSPATTEQNQVEETISTRHTYMCNTNTMKFHYLDCASVKRMSEKNKWEVETTREELISLGYDPCKNCNP